MSPGANEGRRHLDLQAAGDAASAPLGEPKKWPLPESLRASSGAPDSCNCAPTLSLRTASGSHHSIACPMWCQTSLRAAGAPTPPTPGGTEICSHDNAAPPCGCFRDQFSEHARGSREQLARNTTPSGDFTALLDALLRAHLDYATHLDEGFTKPYHAARGRVEARLAEAEADVSTMIEASYLLTARIDTLEAAAASKPPAPPTPSGIEGKLDSLQTWTRAARDRWRTNGEDSPEYVAMKAKQDAARFAVEAEYGRVRGVAIEAMAQIVSLRAAVSRLEGERDAALDRVAEVTDPEAFVEVLPTYVRVLLDNAKAESEALVAALTAELEFGRGVLVDTRTKLFAWADKYESALRAIADQHNNPHCACVFCEDLRAALGSSGSGASHD